MSVTLVPFLSKSSVGIDTSSKDNDTYACIAFFDNHSAGYHYLEKYLQFQKQKRIMGMNLNGIN